MFYDGEFIAAQQNMRIWETVMKGFFRSVFFGFLFLLMAISLGLSGQEAGAVISPAGWFPAEEELRELRVIQAPGGAVYVLRIAGGSFRISRGDGAEVLEDYWPEGLPEGISHVRDLKLSEFGPVQYAAFVGRESPAAESEAVYVLGLDHRGELRYYPRGETRPGMAVSEYRIVCSGDGSAAVYLLAGGRLTGIPGIGGSDSPGMIQDLGGSSDPVDRFDLIWDPRHELGCGWLILSREGEQRIILFLTRNNTLLIREAAGVFDEGTRIHLGMIFDGSPTCTIIRGADFELYQGGVGGINRIVSLRAPLPVSRYYPSAGTEGSFGILIGETGENARVFGVWGERGIAPVFQPWVEADPGGIAEIRYTGEDRLSIIYKKDRLWHAALVRPEPGVITDQTIEALREDSELCFSGGMGPGRIYFSAGGDVPELLFYGFGGDSGSGEAQGVEGGIWTLQGRLLIPEDIARHGIRWDEKPVDSPLYREDRIIPLASESGLIIAEPETQSFRFIESRFYTLSRRINGSVFFAGYTGETVILYRMGEAE
jgi:hypothetical protein